MISRCEKLGEHKFFVAEVVGNEAEGRVFVLSVCTACGEFRMHTADVGEKGSKLRLLLEEKKKEN